MMQKTKKAGLFYPKWSLQRWLKDSIKRASTVFAGCNIKQAFDNFLALFEVSLAYVSEICRSFYGFPVFDAWTVIQACVCPCHRIAWVEARI